MGRLPLGLLAGGAPLGGLGGRGLGLRLRRRFRLHGHHGLRLWGGLLPLGEIGGQVLHIPGLGEDLEDDIQFVLHQGRHIFLGLLAGEVFGQGVDHFLVADLQVLGHISDPVFHHHTLVSSL